jgi:prephenate dehydratase
MKVSFLGPEGSYSHLAALNLYSKASQIELIASHSISKIVQSLEENLVDIAIVPVENSIAGGVAETIDALLKAEAVYINKEYILAVSHCLLGQSNCQISEIKSIKAHPMSFGQCMNFINDNCPDVELIPSSSNSAAALELSQSTNSKEKAVIASKLCAEIYKLEIIKSEINDNEMNQTRFWVLSKNVTAKEADKNKSTIVFQTKDEPGSLQTILRLFAVNHVNLSRIESRPAKRNIGEYMFLIDFDLHKEDKKFEELMRQAKQHFSYYKWLGSYSA